MERSQNVSRQIIKDEILMTNNHLEDAQPNN